MASCLAVSELLTLREQDTDEADSNGQASGNPEHGLPGFDSSTDTQVGTSSTYVAEGISLLHDTAHQT